MSSKPPFVDPEIEKIARRNNSATRRRRAQAQQVALTHLLQTLFSVLLRILIHFQRNKLLKILMVMVEVKKDALWKTM